MTKTKSYNFKWKKFKIVSIITSIVMNAHEKWAWKTQVICKQGNNVWAFPFKKFLFSFTPLVVKYNDNENWKGKYKKMKQKSMAHKWY